MPDGGVFHVVKNFPDEQELVRTLSPRVTDIEYRELPEADWCCVRDFVRDKIHSDLAKHFIHGIDTLTKKRLGENYELQHNDIIKIVSAK